MASFPEPHQLTLRPSNPTQNKLNLPKTDQPSFVIRLGTEMVDLYIGPQRAHFHVHKSLLCELPYFASMFKSGFLEAVSSCASFPSDSTRAFETLIHWIYKGSLPSLGNSAKFAWDPVELWCLANMMVLPILQDQVMDVWRAHQLASKCFAKTGYIAKVYRLAPEGSAPRKYALASMLYMMLLWDDDEKWPTSEFAGLLKDGGLAADWMKCLRGYWGKVETPEDPRKGDGCKFHRHGEGEVCKAAMIGIEKKDAPEQK